MNKEEFFAALRNELGFLPENTVESAVARYETYFRGDADEADVIGSLGGAKGAARDFLSKTPHDRPAPVKKPLPVWARVLAAIVFLPIAVPIAAAALAAAAGLAVLAFAAVFAASIGSVAMWLGGADMIIKAVPMRVIAGDKLMQIGCGIMLFGLGIICMVLMAMFFVKVAPKILRAAVNAGQRLLKRGILK